MEFVRLTDRAHSGMVVRMDGQKQDIFDHKSKKWYRTAMMIDYYCDESNKYEMYEEITESAARKIVEANGGELYADAVTG